MQTTLEIIVREEDIDEFGHVNYKKYIEFSERAIFDWHAKAGASFEKLLERNLGPVLLKLDVVYQKEARLGDILKIVTTPLNLGTKSYVLKQDIFNQNEEHLTHMTKKFVMFDTAQRKGVTVLDEIACKFN